MDTYAVHAERYFLPSGCIDGGYLIVCGKQIGHWQSEKPACEIREYPEKLIAPGLVDTHIHGFCNHDVMDADPSGLRIIAHNLLRCGVTSWLPTTLAAPVEKIEHACSAVADVCETTGVHGEADADDAQDGARIQGIYLEGPFLSVEYRGAQDSDSMLAPSLDLLLHLQEISRGHVIKVALAPEYAGAPEFCAQAVAEGMVVALGHSGASYLDAVRCINAGATCFVHAYNAMSGFGHRKPAMVGATMVARNSWAEMICDGKHISPDAARVLVDVRGARGVVLITDCMRAGGMPEGRYTLGESPVVVSDGAVRLQSSGSLAGSVLTLDRAVKNVVDWGLVTFEMALSMATENPARSAGIADACGFLYPGRKADMSVWNRDATLAATILDGKEVWRAEGL